VRLLPVVALVGLLWLPSPAGAEDPVYFADSNLKARVEQTLWISDPTPTDMLDLTSLNHPNTYTKENVIEDLRGLEYAVNLESLNLRYHEIGDLAALSELRSLQVVILLGNRISDLSPLSGLRNLETLDVEQNEISDLSPLAGLSNLQSVSLHRNYVSDISPLAGLTRLSWVDLRANPLDPDTYEIYIPRTLANNPGVTLLYDAPFHGDLAVSSTAGGAVIHPGEGEFTYGFYEVVVLEAKADPGFRFVGWSGSYSAQDNPLSLTMDQDYRLQANFRNIMDTIHVDDDAVNDPGPHDPEVSDPYKNGTSSHPYDRIQEAIDVAGDGATIFVHAGTYCETIDLLGKRITLTGFDTGNPGVAAWPLIDGGGTGPVVSLSSGRDPNCVLTGLVITGGNSQSVGAIRCTDSSLTMVNCLIVGNRATDWDGTVIRCTNSNAAFINCTIADNGAGQFGASLFLVNSRVMVANSILWGNTPQEIQMDEDSSSSVRYSVVADGWPGPGNLTTDPLFASLGHWADGGNPDATVPWDDPSVTWVMGDYHLQSQAGRWDPKAAQWVQDRTTSPCIDAGDPSTPVGQESSANGSIIDLGAYGGTVEASGSFPGRPLP